MVCSKQEWMMGGLSDSDYNELLGLEYVLTWQYSNNPEQDEIRYKELSEKKWNFRDLHQIVKK